VLMNSLLQHRGQDGHRSRFTRTMCVSPIENARDSVKIFGRQSAFQYRMTEFRMTAVIVMCF